MDNMAQPTQTESKSTQFAAFLRPLMEAASVVFDEFGPKRCIKAVAQKSEKLAQYIRLMIAALETSQELALAEKERPETMPDLLCYVVMRFVLGRTERFVSSDFFKKDNADGVEFYDFNDDFVNNFLPKVEINVPGGTLVPRELASSSVDSQIIAVIGDDYETYLSDLRALLRQQPKGEKGILLTNGESNIFYIRDIKGILWAIGAEWGIGGWRVWAFSVGRPECWGVGRRVFSRWLFGHGQPINRSMVV